MHRYQCKNKNFHLISLIIWLQSRSFKRGLNQGLGCPAQGPSSAHLAAREAHQWVANGGAWGRGGKKGALWRHVRGNSVQAVWAAGHPAGGLGGGPNHHPPPCSPDSARAERLTSGGLSSPLDSGLSGGNITELTFVQSEPLPAHVGLCSFFFWKRGLILRTVCDLFFFFLNHLSMHAPFLYWLPVGLCARIWRGSVFALLRVVHFRLWGHASVRDRVAACVESLERWCAEWRMSPRGFCAAL